MALGNFTSGYANSSDNAPSVTVPSGAVSGDTFVLAIVGANSSFTVSSWPSGFTEIAESANEASLGTRMRVALRTATGSARGSFTSTISSYIRWVAACVIVPATSTLDGSDSTGGYVGYVGGGTPFTLTGGSVTTTGSGRQIVWIGGTRPGTSAGTSTPALPSGFASAGTADNTNGGVVFIGDKSESGGAGSYSYNGTMTNSAGDSQSSLVTTLAFTSGGGGGSTRGMPFGPGTAFDGGRTFRGPIC